MPFRLKCIYELSREPHEAISVLLYIYTTHIQLCMVIYLFRKAQAWLSAEYGINSVHTQPE